jgi:hypothetical protein
VRHQTKYKCDEGIGRRRGVVKDDVDAVGYYKLAADPNDEQFIDL